MTDSDEVVMTHREAAAFLRVHPDTLKRWVREGKVPPPGMVAGSRRYLKSDLVALVRKDRVTAGEG